MRADGGIPTLLTEQADTASDVWRVFLILAIAVFAMVFLLLTYVVIRYRRRGDGLPRQTQYRIPLEVTYTVLPLLLVVGLLVVALKSTNSVDATTDDPDLVVQVLGSQWNWQFTYPDSGVVIGGDETPNPSSCYQRTRR